MRFFKVFLLIIAATISVNADDYDMHNPRYPADNLITGGQPTLADVARLKAAGVTTIINLRGKTEHDQSAIKSAAQKAGMHYINIPIANARQLSLTNLTILDKALKAAADGKTLLHCGSGNRVGSMLALRAHHIKGLSIEEAMAYGKSAGMTRLEEKTRGLMRELK